ncbi:17097_t:CDS:2, partial [Acaulospora colombiana]
TGSFRTAGTAEDPVIEGLRPFVYDDTGKLVRRSLRRNIATNNFRSKPSKKSGNSKKQCMVGTSNAINGGECSTTTTTPHASSDDPIIIDEQEDNVDEQDNIDEHEDNIDDQDTSMLSFSGDYADDCAASVNLSIPDETAFTIDSNAVDHVDSLSEDFVDPDESANIANNDRPTVQINLPYIGGTSSSTNLVADDPINIVNFEKPSNSMNLSYNGGSVDTTNMYNLGNSSSSNVPGVNNCINSLNAIAANDAVLTGVQSDDSASSDELMLFNRINEHCAKDCRVVIEPNSLISSNGIAVSSSSNSCSYNNNNRSTNFAPIQQFALPASNLSLRENQSSAVPRPYNSVLPQGGNSIKSSVNRGIQTVWSSTVNPRDDTTRSSVTRLVSQRGEPVSFRTMISTTTQRRNENRSSAQQIYKTATNLSAASANPTSTSMKSSVNPSSNFSNGNFSSNDFQSGDEERIATGYVNDSTSFRGPTNIDTHQFSSNQDNPWGGVDVSATPEVRVVSWIRTIRKNNVPVNATYYHQTHPQLSSYCGTSNSQHKRMSIAYLCSNEVLEYTGSPNAPSSQEVLPIQKGKAKDNKSGKNRAESPVYRRNFRPGTVWRVGTTSPPGLHRYVHMNPLKRLFDNPNLRLEKLRCFKPGWNSEKLVIVGGNIKYQGTWYPFDHAKRVVEEVVGTSTAGFHPVFGFSDRGTPVASSSKRRHDIEDFEDGVAEINKRLRI